MSKQTAAQLKNYLANIIKNSPYCGTWFYEEHVLVVEKLAMELCDKYPEANRDAVTLMVFLHDIGRADNHSEDHDLYGSEYARKLLTENEFPPDFVDLVAQGCKTHSCDDFGQPTSLEGKILATADAMSHFQRGFYLRIFYAWNQKADKMHYPELENNQNFANLKEKLFAKMDRDFNSKIFFPEAKNAVLPLYQAWQQTIGEIKL
jgi:putative nucleotidyltransferase with HDIG domain